MPTSAPRRPRDLFDAFRLYDREAGLKGLVEQWDLTDVGPHQVYFATLGRMPERDRARRGENYDPAAQFINGLASAEFQQGVVKSILRSYPEKKRMIFIHIPKCAGSHLSQRIVQAYPALNFRLMEKAWVGPAALYESLRVLATRLEGADSIYPFGHLPLKWYFDADLIRFGDLPFSVVRDPARLVLSQVNYIITRFVRDPGLKAPDTRDWLRFLDKARLDASLAANDFRDLAMEILFHEVLVPKNMICRFLGAGTAESAFGLCASAAAELTDMEHYAEWLKARLGVDIGQPSNVSNRYLSLQDLGEDALKRVRAVTEEDEIFVDRLRSVISAPQRYCVSGEELLR